MNYTYYICGFKAGKVYIQDGPFSSRLAAQRSLCQNNYFFICQNNELTEQQFKEFKAKNSY